MELIFPSILPIAYNICSLHLLQVKFRILSRIYTWKFDNQIPNEKLACIKVFCVVKITQYIVDEEERKPA